MITEEPTFKSPDGKILLGSSRRKKKYRKGIN